MILQAIDTVSTIIGFLAVLGTLFAFLMGILPVLWRLGLARWRTKICLAANNEMSSFLKKEISDSGIFRAKNIEPVFERNIDEISKYNLIVVHYASFTEDQFRNILSKKKSHAGMIVYYPEYAPNQQRVIPLDMLKEIGDHKYTTVVNHRGRLLNDLFTTLITTSYG